MTKLISISLSPNLEKDDIKTAINVLLKPLKWFDFRETEKLEAEFIKLFGPGYQSFAVNSGRSALYLILRSIGIRQGDTVAIQALTCTVVANAIIALGARPVYVDVDESFNMDPTDLKKKLSNSTKAIIVQHTFGTPCAIEKIQDIARKNNLYLIEDCATSLGAKYKGKLLGTYADVSFFSFGRDKVISGVFGGMILSKDKNINNSIEKLVGELEYPSFVWFLHQLIHPLITALIITTYKYGSGSITIGKVIHWLAFKCGILKKAVSKDEKMGIQTKDYPKKIPGGLSVLTLNQLKKLDKFNQHRKSVSKIYFDNIKSKKYILPKRSPYSIWHRFPILTDERDNIIRNFGKRDIILGDWYKSVVTPTTDMEKVFYIIGNCPKAEYLSKRLLNLPTSINTTKDMAMYICKELELWK